MAQYNVTQSTTDPQALTIGTANFGNSVLELLATADVRHMDGVLFVTIRHADDAALADVEVRLGGKVGEIANGRYLMGWSLGDSLNSVVLAWYTAEGYSTLVIDPLNAAEVAIYIKGSGDIDGTIRLPIKFQN